MVKEYSDIKNMQNTSNQIWDDLYCSYEEGKPVGIAYPTEALVIFISTQRKPQSLKGYFEDNEKEYSLRNFFSGNALEIGFGSIANLKMVREKGYKCFGLEVSKEAVKRGERAIGDLGLKDIELSYWQPNKIPFPDNYFQLIYGLQCIYYNLELDKVIDEVYRALAPKGIFLFSFFSSSHTYMNFIEKVSGNICRWSDNHPNTRLRGAYFIQPESKAQLAKIFGKFNEVKVFTTESNQTPLFESWWYVTGSKPG
jgi:SAM-dependent methyltransferase